MGGVDLEVIKDIPGYKIIMKAVLHHQIQQLVEQLSDTTGEESILLTASVTDGSLSHLGSESGKSFLEGHDEIKSQFLGHVLKRHHNRKTEKQFAEGPGRKSSVQQSLPLSYGTQSDAAFSDSTYSEVVYFDSVPQQNVSRPALPRSVGRGKKRAQKLTSDPSEVKSRPRRSAAAMKSPLKSDFYVSEDNNFEELSENEQEESEKAAETSMESEIGKTPVKHTEIVPVSDPIPAVVKEDIDKLLKTEGYDDGSGTFSVVMGNISLSGNDNIAVVKQEVESDHEVGTVTDEEDPDWEPGTKKPRKSSGSRLVTSPMNVSGQGQGLEMFDFHEWAASCCLKESTKQLLWEEDLNTWNSLRYLTPELIEKLEITVGQKLLLKQGVKQLKNEQNPGNLTKTDFGPNSTQSSGSSEPSGSARSGQLTLTEDGKLGPELILPDDMEPGPCEPDVSIQEIEEKSKIYFNIKQGKMFEYHSAINEASKQLCLSRPSLLADRKELFKKARKMVHEKGYKYKKKKSRSSLYEKNKEKKKVVTTEIRTKRITELSEDISELDIEMRLQMQQREKHKNINELTKAISCTETLSTLRNKKRKMQDELAILQMKDAKIKKAKKSAENRKAFDLKQAFDMKHPVSYTIDSFLKPVSNKELEDNKIKEKEDSSHEMVDKDANENTGDNRVEEKGDGGHEIIDKEANKNTCTTDNTWTAGKIGDIGHETDNFQ